MKSRTSLLWLVVGLAAVGWLGETSAIAQPAPGRAVPKAKRPKAVFHVSVRTGQMKVLKRVLSLVRRTLRKDERIKYRPIQSILEKPKGSIRRLVRADNLLLAGKKSLANLEVTKAIAQFEKAVRLMQFSFVALIRIKQKTKPLARALRLLASAYFLDGKAKEAKETIQRLLVIAPKTQFSKKLFPRQMAQIVDDERLMFDEFGTSNVEVKTDPPGARVYLNAHRVGRSPITIKGVRKGFNYLTARMPGYRTTTMGLDVDPPKLVRTTLKLRKFKRDPLPHMAGALLEMGRKQAGPGILGMAHRLEVRFVVLAQARAEHDQAILTFYVYDAKKKKLVKGPVTVKPSTDFPAEKLVPAVKRLFDGVEIVAKKKKEKVGPKKPTSTLWKKMSVGWTSFRKSKSFWPVMGTVAGVVVTGLVVGLAVGLSSRGPLVLGSRHVLAHPLARF